MKRYKKPIEDRLGANWYQLINRHPDTVTIGTVKATFRVLAAGGKVRELRIVSNTGSPGDAMVALQAIAQLRPPAVPPPLLAETGRDHIDFDESFTIYANP